MAPRQYDSFNHEQLVNFKISKKKGQTRVEEQVTVIHEHMDVAEKNFTAILQAAVKISKIFSSFGRLTTFDLEGIITLVQDLRTIFRLLRSRLSRQFPETPITGQLAAPGDQIPERIRRDVYPCLCPLTALLKAVAQCLSDLKVAAPSKAGKNVWGTVQPLHGLLVHMEGSLSTTEVGANDALGEHIGLAVCIMLHERNSRYLVTSTAPRYGALIGLDKYGRAMRIAHMTQMRGALSAEAQDRVQSLEAYSESVMQERFAARKAKATWTGVPEAKLATPAAITGENAAFTTTGNYMTACLLDHLRFQMGRTAHAIELEKSKKPEERDVHGTTSCAEWELYIALLHRPDPNRPHVPQFVAVTYGMSKSKTWETNKFNSRPAPTNHQAPRPTPLPTMPKPT